MDWLKGAKSKILFGLSIFILVSGILYASAAFSPGLPWHPIQQITTGSNTGISVDANNNGIVDDADRVGGLSAAEIQAGLSATGTGGASTGQSYSIVLMSQDGTDCPANFSMIPIGKMAGWDGYSYTEIDKNGLYIGGVYAWNNYNGRYMRFRTHKSWGGFACFKTYDINSVKPPRVTVYGVNQTTNCNDFGAGYNSFEINDVIGTGGTAKNNGYTYISYSSDGLFIGQLDWWDKRMPDVSDNMVGIQYHWSHVGKTCWKVDNVS